MGLLEYQAMPSLRDVAYDGWLCMDVIYYITTAGNSISSQLGRQALRKRQAVRPVHHVQNQPPPAGQTGRHVGPALELSAPLVIIHVQDNGLKSLTRITRQSDLK
jgi:hypothetical protein